jgi:hypothetical protein
MARLRAFEAAMRATIERLRAEFLEMPGLRLNLPQTQRLCGADQALCRDVLDALVDLRFLCRNADGTYSRFWYRDCVTAGGGS